MMIITAFSLMISCSGDDKDIKISDTLTSIEYEQLPLRVGERPKTTDRIPHYQLDLDLVPEVHEEMIRRIYNISGIEEQPSMIRSWQGLSLEDNIEIVNPQALIGDRELGHVHDDGSLHIYLEPSRAIEAIDSGWAVSHPFAVEGREDWEGYVMLYTPQSIEELNVVFQLIVDAFNYVTGQQIKATDIY